MVAATGPAPFTGLRAGLVTAGVVGRTRGVPVHGVSSLDAVARRALDELGAQEGQTGSVVLVATDARRREVYTALFRANGPDDVTRLTEIIVCSPAQVAQRLADGYIDAQALSLTTTQAAWWSVNCGLQA
mgnify:CR=1 FL=1